MGTPPPHDSFQPATTSGASPFAAALAKFRFSPSVPIGPPSPRLVKRPHASGIKQERSISSAPLQSGSNAGVDLASPSKLPKLELAAEDVKPELPLERRRSPRKQRAEVYVEADWEESEDEVGDTDFEDLAYEVLDSPSKRGGTGHKKKRSTPKTYSDPSVYAHLAGLQDVIAPGLSVLFTGINPGKRSATEGFHYCHPTNSFWRCLHEAGFTERKLDPREGIELLQVGLGMTNLVERPTTSEAELSETEKRGSVPSLFNKLIKHRPKIVSFVGMGICKSVMAHLRNRSVGEQPPSLAKQEKGTPRSPRKAAVKVEIGFQPFKLSLPPLVEGAARDEVLFHCMPSTSGLTAAYQVPEKIKIFTKLREQRDELILLGAIDLPKSLIIVDYRAEDFVLPQVVPDGDPIPETVKDA